MLLGVHCCCSMHGTATLLFLLLLSLVIQSFGQSGDGRPREEDDDDFEVSFGCENSLLTLRCKQPGQVIRVVRANYGRFTLSMCNPLGITSNMDLKCQSLKSRAVVASECDGHNKCEVQIDNRLFGDPCPGTSKYAEVKYYCEDGPSVPVPEKIRACLHPLAGGSYYDLYWNMPKSDQTIGHFMLKYMAQGEVNETEMPSNKLNDSHYSFTFTPNPKMRGSVHQFAIKAFSLDYGWGEYSEFSVASHCPREDNEVFIAQTLSPSTSTSTSTTTTSPTTVAPSLDVRDGGPLRLMCQAEVRMGVRWPETWPNEERLNSCPSYLGRGQMRYKCLSYGVWDPRGPETNDCVPVPPTTTTTTTSTTTTATTTSLATTPSPERYAPKVYGLLRSLGMKESRREAMQHLVKLLPGLVRNLTEEILAFRDPRMRKDHADNFKETMLTVGDDLLKDGSAWSHLNTSMQRSAAASLLDSLQMTGLLAASTLPSGTFNTTLRSNLVMKLMHMRVEMRQDAVLESIPQEGTITKVNRFIIPASVLQQVSSGKYRASLPVVFVVASNMSEWLIPDPIDGDQNIIDSRQPREPVRRIVNSDIVTASISSKSVQDLHEPVMFVLEHRQIESVVNPKCSFWDTDLGSWSHEGCWVLSTNKTHTVCQCSHLTSFAVLMDITGATLMIPAQTRFSLELITYIGCTISIICLMLSFVTFVCFKNLDCERNTIHKNLVFCLMVAQILLVTGIQQTQPTVLCSVIAGILHFCFLASFAWMCLEGVQLYVMLIEVFQSERSRLMWFYIFGYGMPTVIVAISSAIFPGGYGTKNHCWLTTERGFIWSFVGPAMGVILINIVMLVIAIAVMMRHSNSSHTMRQKTLPQKIRSWLRGAVVLVVLLGLTWVFGILYLDNVYHTLVFSYIFTFLNSLQGLFIFFFHCVLNEKVQKEYRRLVRHNEWLPDFVRVKYGGASSSASRDPSDSGNVMSKFLRGKKKPNGCGDSSGNSARPFLGKDARFSSSCPSSSDGATSSRLSTETSNNNRKSSRSSTCRSVNDSGIHLLRPHDGGGMVGDLSEIPDCSVVDSEFVSEYCQENLRVTAEVKRYSTASEDSGHNEGSIQDVGERGIHDAEVDLDRLAALSVESLSTRPPAYRVSRSDFGDGDNRSDGWADSDNVDGEEDAPGGQQGASNCSAELDTHGEDSYTDEADEDDEELMDERDGRVTVCHQEVAQSLMSGHQADWEKVVINNAANKPQDMTVPQGPLQQPALLTEICNGHLCKDAQQTVPTIITVPPSLSLRLAVSETCPRTVTGLGAERRCANGQVSGQNDSRFPNRSAAQLAGPSTGAGKAYTTIPVKRTSSDGHVYFSPFRFPASEC